MYAYVYEEGYILLASACSCSYIYIYGAEGNKES